MRELILVSVEDGATLSMSCAEEAWGSIDVRARGPGFDVSAPVYVNLAPSLADFLDQLAATPEAVAKRGSWGTLEDDFRIDATTDSKGHVYLTYQLRSPDIGSNRWWSFRGRLVLELGGMPRVCKQARRFWNAAN
jgi:hypothetical protein